jgi:hypothetical protein
MNRRVPWGPSRFWSRWLSAPRIRPDTTLRRCLRRLSEIRAARQRHRNHRRRAKPVDQSGNDLVTKLKIKNTSSGSIHLLRINEWWYDGSTPRQMVTAGEERYNKKPINPGEIIEISIKSPFKSSAVISQLNFAHANGKVEAKTVKKL